jgi:DNA-binding beta-propeller fold protein YncE
MSDVTSAIGLRGARVLALAVVFLLAVPLAPGRAAVRPVALVTAETENELVAVDPDTGQILRRVSLPADPEYVGVKGATVVVVSGRAGAVSLLAWPSLRLRAVLHGFGQPHLVAFSPKGNWAYVTDDERGQLDVINLATQRVVSRIYVGPLAHHLAVSPDGRRLWIALSESARTIVVVDLSHPAQPRVSGRFDPGFAVHDLEFSPNGKDVWATGAATPRVGVFDAANHRLLFSVTAASGPQHVAFAGRYAYIASGYGSSIEQVNASTGKVLRTTALPYGSFELAASDGLVVTSSLFDGRLAVLNGQLRLLRVVQVAPVTRDVTLVTG